MNVAEQHIAALEAKVAALRQPCSHAPQWGVAECAWCRVRAHLKTFMRAQKTSLADWQQQFVMAAFDAAVQAGREDHR